MFYILLAKLCNFSLNISQTALQALITIAVQAVFLSANILTCSTHFSNPLPFLITRQTKTCQ